MAVENRDLGPAQQRETFCPVLGAVATGGTVTALVVPFPAQFVTGAIAALGVSNTPVINIDVTRYLTAGVTTITGVIASPNVVGATISVGFTASSGASLVSLQTGDVLVARLSGTNANITGGALFLVLQALQDVKTHFGK